jgi:hypothetical protein
MNIHTRKKMLTLGNYVDAINLINNVTPENTVESNQIYILNLIAQQKLSGIKILDSTQTETLTNMAAQTIWEGGEAVISARIILNMEVDDMNAGLRGGIHAFDEYPENEQITVESNQLQIILIELQNSGFSNFTLFDTFGKQQKINATFDLASISNGVYLIICYDCQGHPHQIKTIKY